MALDPGDAAARVSLLATAPSRVRTLCVLAHVDHGKTTLSDALIAHNGLMHPKMVGKLRYMDFREDEQDRGITMKSASISLLYTPRRAAADDGAAAAAAGPFLVNLIDSPGHVDFCSEVSSAARLSDGALVLVDAVEGVCTQTHAVLRQVWEEKITPVLVINKIDRLITELRLTPLEAYERLKRVIAEANRVMSAFASEKHLSDADAFMAAEADGDEGGDEVGGGNDDEDAEAAAAAAEEEPEGFSFAPERGNVAFASAADGWAFRPDAFADIYAARLGCSAAVLRRALWGDWYYQPKARRIVGKRRAQADAAPGARLRPLFVQLALEPLWQLYAAADAEADAAAAGGDAPPPAAGKSLADMAKALCVADMVPKRDLAAADRRSALRAVLRAWLPLSEAVLAMVVQCLPDPVTAAQTRAPYLCSDEARAAAAAAAPDADVAAMAAAAAAGMLRCDASAPSALAFVSKMFAVPPGALPAEKDPSDPSGEGGAAPRERFLAFARVFGGTLRAGDAVHVLPPGAPPCCPPPDAPVARVGAIYLMMGRALQPVSAAPAGAVVALAGLDTAVLKCATLATAPCCAPLRGMYLQAAPTVRVALEPRSAAELPALLAGLALLNRADPSVEVRVAPSGEVTLGVAGEVHLQRCLTDLRERFARVDVAASPPLVAFRESAAAEAWPAMLAALLPREKERERARDRERDRDRWAAAKEVRTPNGWCVLRARVAPLPAVAARALDEAAEALRGALATDDTSSASASSSAQHRPADASATAASLEPTTMRALLQARLDEAEAAATASEGEPVEGAAAAAVAALRRAWALGPQRCGANVLLIGERRGAGVPPAADADAAPVALGAAAAAAALGFADVAAPPDGSAGGDAAAAALWADVAAGVAAGFQAACERGPLCDEPLWGCVFDVCAELTPEALAASAGADGAAAEGPACAAPFAGQVMDAARKAMRAALEAASPRLVEQLFLCVVATAPEALGGMYGVLSKRRARVLTERMLEGSGAFRVAAALPVAASFGLADELRARTSGAAGAQLMLSHWERVAQDPRFVPTTADELEEFGADAAGAGPNAARALVDAVRRRKGLPVEEKVVAVATKQRTQARKR